MTVLHLVIDAETGGAQTLIRNLAEHRQRVNKIVLVVIKGPGALSPELERVCDVVYYLNYRRSTFDLLGMVRKVDRIVRNEETDILHTHLLHSDLIGALVPRRHLIKVSTIHTTGMSSSDPLRSKIVGKLVARLSNRHDSLVACSDGAREYMKRTGYGMQKTHVIYNGVPIESGQATNTNNAMVSLARWHPMKDHKTLFEAFAKSGLAKAGWLLHCAGNQMDEYNEQLKDLISMNGLEKSVVLHGSLLNINELLTSARALVLSSSYGEALPMAALEALSKGVPVISTDVGAAHSLALRPELLVPTADTTALADSMNWIAGVSDSEMKVLGTRAQNRVREEFDIKSTVSKYEATYMQSRN